ncbi:MAG: glycosyltransferase [Patescibacteria group bacterium]
MKKISVVIPSYNALNLLKKNLPKVMQLLSEGDELIIVDDASKDESIPHLIKTFNCQQQTHPILEKYSTQVFRGSNPNHVSVTVLLNLTNQRFAESVNRGVLMARNKFILLLNNDVIPNKNIKSQLLKHFADENVFAVGCREIEDKGISGGKNLLWFNRGLFHHSRAEDFKTGSTAWASGGSAIFDRDKWITLGGFDNDYYPAYWEDVDLSYRAKKKGWRVLFDNDAVVEHHHESTNLTVFGKEKIEQLSRKQAAIFSWKNGNWLQKLSFVIHRPYWWYQQIKTDVKSLFKQPSFVISQNSRLIAFVAVIVLSALLRFYKLADVPHGMTWDEAAIGYNGYAVFHTRRDEWLQFLPVSFKSFGDYKAPLAIYINGISTFFFGMNLWSVRLPFVLISIGGVVGFMLLTEELISLKNRAKTWLIFLAGVLFTTSPWFLHLTRTGFESGMATSFLVWSVFFFQKMTNKLSRESVLIRSSSGNFYSWKKNRHIIIYGLLGAITSIMSIYTYHSAKIVVPLIVISMLLPKLKTLLNSAASYLVMVISLLGLYPFLKDSLFGSGLERSKTMIFFQAESIDQIVETLINNFFAHFSASFLIQGQTDSLRHGSGHWGVLLPSTVVFIILALVIFSYKAIKRRNHPRDILLYAWLLFFMLVGLLPAIFSPESPHSNRALMALPAFILFAVIGVKYLIHEIVSSGRQSLISRSILGLGLTMHLLFFLAYQQYYYQVFAKSSANDFMDGYLEAFELAQQYEKGIDNKKQVDKIIFTSDYGQPYIYALFVRKTNPIWYQGGSLIKYEFRDEINQADLARKNSLIVASLRDNLPIEEANHIVYGSDNRVRFKLYVTE